MPLFSFACCTQAIGSLECIFKGGQIARACAAVFLRGDDIVFCIGGRAGRAFFAGSRTAKDSRKQAEK